MSETKKPRTANRSRSEWRWWALVAGAVFVAWGLVVLVKDGPGETEWGTFGDAFGPLTGLFTGLALVLTVRGLAMQRRELALQRRELRLQRSESRRAREELAAQKHAQEKLAAAQRRANTLAETRLAFENQRLRWERNEARNRFRLDTLAILTNVTAARVTATAAADVATGSTAVPKLLHEDLQKLLEAAVQLRDSALAEMGVPDDDQQGRAAPPRAP